MGEALLRVSLKWLLSGSPASEAVGITDRQQETIEVLGRETRLRYIALQLLIGVSYAQGPVPVSLVNPSFEVASVKLIEPSTPYQAAINPGKGGLIAKAKLTDLIKYAYRLRDFQLSGGPGWMQDQAYDITAKAELESTPEQIRVMLRNLLPARLMLLAHRETRELPALALVVAKTGPTLSPAKDGERQEISGRFSMGSVMAIRVSMQHFAEFLSLMLGGPVFDRTGLSGAFDFKLKW